MSLTEEEEELLEGSLEKDLPKVRQLLDAGISPNIKLSYNEYSPLHFAVHPPANAELLQMLIKAGAEVHTFDKDLHTPLHDTKDPECAEILIKAGANLDLLTKDGETVLHRVANFHESCYLPPPEEDSDEEEEDEDKKNSPETINTDSLSKLSYQGNTIQGAEVEQDALHDDKKYSPKKHYIPPWDGESKQVECARVMIEAGKKKSTLDINAKDKAGMTAMHVAAVGGGSGMMKLFLKNGADVNGGIGGGITPLHRTAVPGYVECAKVLLDANVNVNLQDVRGDTALHLSAQNAHRRFTKMLILNGANKTLKNKKGDTAKDIAKKEGHAKVVRILSF